jgi:glycosyltransferase involved in cell wall biosynthesis
VRSSGTTHIRPGFRSGLYASAVTDDPIAGEPIRVLRVIARLNVGGPALHVAYLSAGLAERGYETTLVAGDVAKGEESMAFVAESAGVEVVRLPGLSREISPVRDLLAALRVAREIRRTRPHILHTHTAKAGAIGRAAAVLAGRARPQVVIHTYHGHVLNGYFGLVGTSVFRAIERILARFSDALVAVSPQVRDDLVALDVAPAQRFAVVRLGIDLEPRVQTTVDAAELRRRLGIGSERFVVGWFGRMTAVKRTDDLIDVLVALHRRDIDACVLLVGDGTDRERLEQRARDGGVARDVFFLGYQKDVASWYALADAVVLTSVNEGTPVTIIEALAAGRPVVTTNVGGVADVVRDGIDGFLVEVGDTEGMATRLAEIAVDPRVGRRLAASGRDRVLSRYAIARLVDDIDRLYRSML